MRKESTPLVAAGIGLALVAGAAFLLRPTGPPAPLEATPEDSRPSAGPGSPPGTAAAGGAASPVSRDLEDSIAQRLERVLHTPDLTGRRVAAQELAEYLVRAAPGRGREVFQSLHNLAAGNADADTYTFVQVFSQELAKVDPEGALAFSEVLPERLKHVAYQFISWEWIKTDPVAAAEWGLAVGDDGLRSTVIRGIDYQLTAGDPKGIAPKWAAELAAGPDAVRHPDIIAKHWSRGNLDAAFDWAAELEDEHAQDSAFVAIAGTLAESEPVAAARWVEQFPPGQSRSMAIGQTAGAWAKSDPPAAARWVQGLDDAEAQTGVLQTIATAWLAQDKAAATKWIEGAPFSDDMRNYLLGLSIEASVAN